MTEFKKDRLTVKIADNAVNMGKAAANDICNAVNKLLCERDEVNMIFAAAPSQNTMLEALLGKDIDWSRINAFHMDEYIGLPPCSSASFQHYLREHIFSKLCFKSVNYINANTEDKDGECMRYAALLQEHPADIVCLGVGENGHIAFNDPGVADFNDKKLIKPVKLDRKCRMQQVHDGCFKTINDVPEYALTLTVPALTKARYMFCSVPYSTKAKAVRKMLTEDIAERCPASVLRLHTCAILYCDRESSKELGL